MGIIQRGADLVYTFRFIKLLVTRWDKTDAYKHGIIDADGKVLRPASDLKTSEEKASYTYFHRLVYNIKRLINKIPLVGRSTLASWAAALWLIKEETGMSESKLVGLLEKYCKENNLDLDTKTLSESNNWLSEENGDLRSGSYQLRRAILSPETGEVIAPEGSNIMVVENTKPVGSILGSNIYKVEHIRTRSSIYVSTEDLLK